MPKQLVYQRRFKPFEIVGYMSKCKIVLDGVAIDGVVFHHNSNVIVMRETSFHEFFREVDKPTDHD